MASFTVVPHKTAVIGVDLQNCFVEDSPVAAPAGPKVVDKLNGLADVYRNRRRPGREQRGTLKGSGRAESDGQLY
jgi:hypothetical protein